MDKVLKQRLIGASILIALAVIFVPMLFVAPDDDLADRHVRIDIPDPPDDRATVRRMPLDPAQARARDGDAAGRNESADASGSDSEGRSAGSVVADIEAGLETSQRESRQDRASTSAPADDDDRPDTVAPDRSDPEPEAEPAVEPEAQGTGGESAESAEPTEESDDLLEAGGWVLQVASFSVESNADDLIDQLTRLGHVASVSRLVRGDTTLHRVITGPYSASADAERAKDQIERTVMGVAPVVRGGASAASGSSAADGALTEGFSVQVGSFASRNNAVRLLGQLESLDFNTFIHEDVSGRRTIWRVRVGLLETREQATELLSQIAERTALEGLVVSHP